MVARNRPYILLKRAVARLGCRLQRQYDTHTTITTEEPLQPALARRHERDVSKQRVDTNGTKRSNTANHSVSHYHGRSFEAEIKPLDESHSPDKKINSPIFYFGFKSLPTST
ncbi:unnamed protein product [Ectocarpus sp. 6 AP-2014]